MVRNAARAEQRAERGRLEAGRAGKLDLREERRPRHLHVEIRCDELRLGAGHVRPALQQCGRQAGGDRAAA